MLLDESFQSHCFPDPCEVKNVTLYIYIQKKKTSLDKAEVHEKTLSSSLSAVYFQPI